MLRKRKCKICGEWYRPKVHNQKTCSKECSEKLRKTNSKISQKRYYKNNKEEINAWRREDYSKNPEKYRERWRKWYDKYTSNREQNIEDIMNAYYEYLDDCGVE
jgi:hypothetical protein